jgi:ribonucleoside-diphosphate reductase beta chain
MEITQIIKRDYETSEFVLNKITNAIEKAMISVDNGTRADAEMISQNVLKSLLERKNNHVNYIPTVEQVQDIVEDELMHSAFPHVAKAYILYRNEQARNRETNIFEKRINLKPYEYPQLNEYVDAIRHSYWIHTEFNYTSDIQDFKTGLNDVERSAIKNTMLAISQIEVAVKT